MMAQHGVGALIVMPDPFFFSRRERVAEDAVGRDRVMETEVRKIVASP